MFTNSRTRLPVVARATAVLAAAGGLLVAGHPAPSGAATLSSPTSRAFTFTTLDDQADPTFNQLLGINKVGEIAGYFGIGSATHPNKGYVLLPPYGQSSYVNENFPGSVETQVTAVNNHGDTAGFWVDGNNTNHGFIEWNGVFKSFDDPHTPKIKGSVNQLLGINDHGNAVGFYNDAAGNAHAYSVNQATGTFTPIKTTGTPTSVTATGINDKGDVVGFETSAGQVSSFLVSGGHLTALQFPGGSNTQALGVNNSDEIVGSYDDGANVMHGFLLKKPMGPISHWTAVDDPNGIGSTVVNGINDKGDVVGFYTDAAANVDGFLAQ